MQPDLWSLYELMLKSRLFEKAVARLWQTGLISGEMHLGMGEEGICAGVVSHLQEGDALALDHRGTPPLLMRGINPVSMLREFLGRPDGLCAGMGGHMHLYSKHHLAASSGIVGASGPAGAGFALAAQHLRAGNLAISFFGEGAVNQGMLMESMNLAVVWKLPQLFVCKDNQWSILTSTPDVTGGKLVERARGMGMPAIKVDGSDVEAVWYAARGAIQRARQGEGPTFIHATCVHLEGHFLGDPYRRFLRQPLQQAKQFLPALTQATIFPGGLGLRGRAANLRELMPLILQANRSETVKDQDPLFRTRTGLRTEADRLLELESRIAQEIDRIVKRALEPIATDGS